MKEAARGNNRPMRWATHRFPFITGDFTFLVPVTATGSNNNTTQHTQCRESEIRPQVRCHPRGLPTVAAVYDRRFSLQHAIKPAVIDRRYSRKAPMDGIEFVNEFLTQDTSFA